MKAIAQDGYGSADRLELREVDKPVPDAGSVLIRVRAASVNPLDWHEMRGLPWLVRTQTGLRRPRNPIRGVDAAGEVESVGDGVTEFRAGDAVFGRLDGAFAEYATTSARNLARKPERLTFEQAAAMPVAGVTALQAVRDHGLVDAGQHVLINGAAGGVGTFAVQIVKALGAHVTGVCSTTNVELVRGVGADRVIDYTRDDFTRDDARYDVIVDTVGSRSVWALRRVMPPAGRLIIVGSRGNGRLLGPLSSTLRSLAVARVARRRAAMFIATIRGEDLAALVELVEAGSLTPVVDRTYPLGGVPDAIRHLETGHARAKTVIVV